MFDWLGREIEPTGDGNTVQEIAARIAIEQAAVLPAGWPHEAPERPLSVSEAHQATQRHIACHIDTCPRKAAAWRTLVEAGKVAPDARRGY
ncbi:hypothetical protein ACWEKT_39625 [Nocardia takedensis]